MKLFVFSKKAELSQTFHHLNLEFSEVDLDHDFSDLEDGKCLIIIDIDVLKEEGFKLASKLSSSADFKAVIIGVTKLDVDSRGSKFDFFLNSYEEVKEKFQEIVQRYEEI